MSAGRLGAVLLLAAGCGPGDAWRISDEQAPAFWYLDLDLDGFGVESERTSEDRDTCEGDGLFSCAPRPGDCDDSRSVVHPWAAERCNHRDDDCDGLVDDDDGDVIDPSACFGDEDLDGWGVSPASFEACDCGDGYAGQGGDCDDRDVSANPGADERCNGRDDDCDGQVDEVGTAEASTWYPDRDADGWGDLWHPWEACVAPDGYIATGEDCDDTDPGIHPGADDAPYDGLDTDCDGWDDDDADRDGYRATAARGDDCDDADATVHPGAQETCDGADDDCDGAIDVDAADASAWYGDADGDGWGSGPALTVDCVGPSGSARTSGDCDDLDPAVHPEALDADGDGADDDCDGIVDDDALLYAAGALALGAAGDALGSAVAFAGDVDGDGQQDLLLGAAGLGAGGSAQLMTAAGAALATFEAAASGAGLGLALAGPGDLDGDGFPDLALGAPDDGATAAAQGVVFLVSGAERGALSLDLATAGAALVGEAAQDRAGYAASPGDFDGDGAADLLVAAPGEATLGAGAGAIYLVAGPITGVMSLSRANAKILGQAAGDGVAAAVNVGDSDGDGQADLLVGAWGVDDAGTNAGAAGLFLGPVWGSADLGAADARLVGEAPQDLAGWSVGAPGDVDGDGTADLLVGAVGHDGGGAAAGAAYLVLGPAGGDLSLADAAARVEGDAAGDWAGARVDGGGDLMGDGGAWLLVGAPGSDLAGAEGGVLALFSGPLSGSLRLAGADVRLVGAASAGLGEVLASGRDQDADGATDLLLGAPDLDGGAVWLWLGGTP